jgi:hypothetical protein
MTCSTFNSRDEVIAAVLASCFVPKYTSRDWTRKFRGTLILDGGFTGLVPSLKGVETIKVQAKRRRRNE